MNAVSGNSPYEPPPGFPPSEPPGYPPQQDYQPNPTYPPPGTGGYEKPKRSNTVWIVLGVALALGVLVIGGCAVGIVLLARSDTGSELISELAIDFSDGVAPTGPVSCEVDGLDFADDYRVFVTVTNESGVASHYLVDYELTGPGGELIGTDFGIVSNLEAGATERDDSIGTVNGDTPPEDVICTVVAASRVDADG